MTTVHPSRAADLAKSIDPHAVTISGIVLNPTYGPESPPESLKNIDREIPAPGQFPYTRGLFPEGYRTRLWTMRQFAGFGSADDTNKRFKYLLDAAKTSTKANTGLSTAFDLPTLMGRDSDDPLSIGEVGKCGVAISTIEDMHRLYADIPVDRVTVSQTINGPAAVIWAMYLAMATQRGISWTTLGGTLQNDILKEFHSQNEFIYPPEPSVKLVVDTIEFQSKFVPKWHSVSISGYHIREAGSTATQELAFTLRDGMEYVEASILRGLDVNDFGPRLSFFFNSHNEFFEEVCKLRAARRIWARMMRDRYGATNPKAWYMKTHVQTAGCSLTEQQPLNNIVRVAYQALAAVLGGCQSLHTDSMDETLGLPTEQAVTVALRTQQILAHETGVTRVTDPLGGSWFIESLTDKMEQEALAYIAEIDDMGGGPWKAIAGQTPAGLTPGGTALQSGGSSPSGAGVSPASFPPSRDREGAVPSPASAASPSPNHGGYGGAVQGIHRGYFRRKIAEASYRFSEECEAGDRIIVGLNQYVDNDEKRPIDILVIPDSVETEQVARLQAFKARRSAADAAQALDNIRLACQGKPYTLVHDLPGIPKHTFAGGSASSASSPSSPSSPPSPSSPSGAGVSPALNSASGGSARRAESPSSSLSPSSSPSLSSLHSPLATRHSPPPLHPTNVMPALIDGALCNCTLGEMVQAMADIYGRYAGGPEW